MSALQSTIPPGLTKEQYERMNTNWKTLNDFGQGHVTESTWQKIKEGEESIFKPIEDTEDSIIDGVMSFLHTTQGIVAMIILLIVLVVGCGLCYFVKGCLHDCNVRRRLDGMHMNNTQLQQSRPLNGPVMDTTV